jgi:transposase
VAKYELKKGAGEMEETLRESREGIEATAERAVSPERVRRRGETPGQQIRRAKHITRRAFTAEDKIRIVMEGIRGEISVSELCRRERLHNTVYYRWLKDFMEGGKKRLRGDVQREAGREEVASLKEENARLKQLVADYALDLMALKKSLMAEL